MHFATGRAKLYCEGGRHHHFIGCSDVGKLGIHFRTDEFEFNRVDKFPGFGISFKHDIQDALDDALFCLSEIAPFDTCVKTSITAKQIIYQEKHQARIKHHQGGAAQWFHLHQIKVGGHHQIANEFAVLGNAYRAHRHFSAAPQETEQTDPEQPGTAFIDDF